MALGALGALGLSLAASCASDSPLAPGLDTQLVGVWTTSRDAVAPQGSWQRTVAIASGGWVVWRGVSYGAYPGQSPSDLSVEVIRYGHLTASPGLFVLQSDSIVTRDRFYGPSHRDVQRDLGVARDTTRYTVTDDVLTLTYYTYPADAPILTTETLYRVRPD